MRGLTHVDGRGEARMVDVSGKPSQRRVARARGRIALAPETQRLIRRNRLKKGDVLAVARVAGIQAAKQTHLLIPLCHPLRLDWISVQAELVRGGVEVTSEVVCVDRTGAEMEALTAVSVALLTIYDMCKAADRGMRIGAIRLLEKVKSDVE